MEKKTKIIIVILVLALAFCLWFVFWNKPKKFDKTKLVKSPNNQNLQLPNVNYITVNQQQPSRAAEVIETITAEEAANRLHTALSGTGTDTTAVKSVFLLIDSNEEFDAVMDTYQEIFGEDFSETVNDELEKRMIRKVANKVLAEKGIERTI
ncbi:MAG: hypothetical protein K5860_06645 [Bacteroidales bacterium]|nr:hypothetical protein [Bacteroidales bacterium]